MTVVAAMGQMFYSLSIAMGILITFGSYMKKDVSIEDSTRNVEVFDTAIAIMAGLMIIRQYLPFPVGDPDTLQAGPGVDVYYDSEGIRKHGIWNSSGNFILRTRVICSDHKLDCTDRECSVYL